MSDTNEGESEAIDYLDGAVQDGEYWGSTEPHVATDEERVAAIESGNDVNYLDYINDAEQTGVSAKFLSPLKDAWKGASSFAKENKEILGMVGSGISNAQKEKAASERQDKQNQYLTATAAQKRTWDLEDAARKKADEKELWDRRNQSIIDMKPVDMGIIGKNMYDSQLAYMQSRKK